MLARTGFVAAGRRGGARGMSVFVVVLAAVERGERGEDVDVEEEEEEEEEDGMGDDGLLAGCGAFGSRVQSLLPLLLPLLSGSLLAFESLIAVPATLLSLPPPS